MATRFFLCATCGNVVAKVIEGAGKMVCCGEEMIELKPGVSDGAVEKHLPVVEKTGECSVKVKVGSMPHPMMPNHHIVFIYLETEHGGQLRYLNVPDGAEAVFCTCEDKPVAAYAFCNLHGLWKTDLAGLFKDQVCCKDQKDQQCCREQKPACNVKGGCEPDNECC